MLLSSRRGDAAFLAWALQDQTESKPPVSFAAVFLSPPPHLKRSGTKAFCITSMFFSLLSSSSLPAVTKLEYGPCVPAFLFARPWDSFLSPVPWSHCLFLIGTALKAGQSQCQVLGGPQPSPFLPPRVLWYACRRVWACTRTHMALPSQRFVCFLLRATGMLRGEPADSLDWGESEKWAHVIERRGLFMPILWCPKEPSCPPAVDFSEPPCPDTRTSEEAPQLMGNVGEAVLLLLTGD